MKIRSLAWSVWLRSATFNMLNDVSYVVKTTDNCCSDETVHFPVPKIAKTKTKEVLTHCPKNMKVWTMKLWKMSFTGLPKTMSIIRLVKLLNFK